MTRNTEPPKYNMDQVNSVNQPNSRKRERTMGRTGKATRQNNLGQLVRNLCYHTRKKECDKY